MVGKTAPIKEQHRARFETIKTYCGCLPCLLLGHPDIHTSIEHVTESGRRVGEDSAQHEATIGLCAWHHFGICYPGRQVWMMVEDYGPSLAMGRKPFEKHFGDEVKVLIPVTDFMLELYQRDPWGEYCVPRQVIHKVRQYWISLT